MAENMIKFLRGNVASLPQTATEGALYFTKDEGVYLGLADGSYHRYGDFIQVNAVADLPVAGAHVNCMYYCVAENILAKWDGKKWVQINKQKTLAELGGVAKSAYDTKMTALEKADSDNATAISNLSTLVGTIPEGAGADTVIAYINKKTDGIATSGNLEALARRVTTAEGEIDDLQAAIADGGSVANAIADAKKAGTDAAAAVDALEAGQVKTNKEAIEAINNETTGILAQAKSYADGKDTAIATAQSKADSAYALAESKATMTEVNAAISGAGHAVKTEVDQAISDLDSAYKAADSALETKLQGNIDKKVDQTAYDTKVGELADKDTRLAGLISDMDTAYKAADTALGGRITTLEGQITGLSGAMHFEGIKAEVPSDVSGYESGDVIIVGEKEYVFNGTAFVEFGDVSAEGERIGALETTVGKAADGENEATGLVKSVADNASAINAEKSRAEGAEANLAQADADNLVAAKKYADDNITALQNGKADKATTLAGYGITDAYTKTETYTKDEVQELLTWGEF